MFIKKRKLTSSQGSLVNVEL